jgi:hypothetical protein
LSRRCFPIVVEGHIGSVDGQAALAERLAHAFGELDVGG